MVLNDCQLEGQVYPEHSHERVVRCRRKGRGFALVTGVQHAVGQVILFLHADTALPQDWSTAIMQVLQDERCVGGGFSLAFDRPTLFLKVLVRLTRIRFHLTGVMFGDRALFARADTLIRCLTCMNVPIFEDVRLAHCLRRHGRTVLLRSTVTTSADAFHKRGTWRHLWRIVKCQLWYALGGDLDQIFRYYYSA